MDDRELVLGAIQDRGGSRLAEKAVYVAHSDELCERFFSELTLLGGQRITRPELEELAKKRKWVDENVARKLEVRTDVAGIWQAEVGFSQALCGIAETGTLVFVSGPDSARLTTLVPPTCVVLLNPNLIVPTLNEALPLLRAKANRNVVLVTGPSRTADIEGILVRGVHGPGELLVYLDGQSQNL